MKTQRTGFTLVEMIVVMLIVVSLAALVLRAVNGAIIAAREASVVVDIGNIESGCAAFLNRYGMEPPSFMVLCEDSALWHSDWSTAPPVPGLQGMHRSHSRSTLRQIWPDFDFLYGGTQAAPGRLDINGDGDDTDVLILNGAECLLFFLAGLQEFVDTDSDGADDSWTMTGFSPNPQMPFARGGARTLPMCNIFLTRLVDIDADMGNPEEGMLEYVDPIPNQRTPYQYLSGYTTNAARPFGLDYNPATKVNPSTVDDELIARPKGLADAYWQKAVGGTPATPTTPAIIGTPVYERQIISPGLDGEFGLGGTYDGLLIPSTPNERRAERDNITSFKRGRLN